MSKYHLQQSTLYCTTMNMRLVATLRFLVVISICYSLVASAGILLDEDKRQQIRLEWHVVSDDAQGRDLALQDFESGTTSPWADESVADARWNIETYDSPFDPTVPAPSPASGSNYLRVNRPPGTSGQVNAKQSRNFNIF